jgi:hypothetical protein
MRVGEQDRKAVGDENADRKAPNGSHQGVNSRHAGVKRRQRVSGQDSDVGPVYLLGEHHDGGCEPGRQLASIGIDRRRVVADVQREIEPAPRRRAGAPGPGRETTAETRRQSGVEKVDRDGYFSAGERVI